MQLKRLDEMTRFALLVSLIVIILLLSKAYKSSDPIIITTIDTLEVKHDSLIYRKGKDILKDTIIYDTISVNNPVDTNAILKEYFAKHVYKDTITIQDGSIAITDTISKNAIFGRSVSASITHKVIKEVRELRIPYQPKGELYIGGNATTKGTLGAGLIYKMPYKGQIQLNINTNKEFQIGYFKKIL
jgi:hypothetical protein